MAKKYGKNNWALFLIILAGIVLGSFLGYLARDTKGISWLYYGMNFSIGDTAKKGVVCVNLGVLILYFGLKIKITVASIIGVVAAIFIYRKL